MKHGKSADYLFWAADELGLSPEWISPYGLFSIKLGGELKYIFYGISVLNSELSCYLARNKHATRIVLAKNDLPNIPYSLPDNRKELESFYEKHGKIIIKPTLGSRSRGIKLIDTRAKLDRAAFGSHICEKFIDGTEYRYLVLNRQVIAVQKRIPTGKYNRPGQSIRISVVKKEWVKELCRLALDTSAALDLNYCAVDIIVDKRNRTYVLEVNTSPGLQYFVHPHEGPAVQVPRLYLEAVVKHYSNSGK